MLRSVELSDYMVRHPVKVLSSITIYEAARKILEHKISGVAVVDDNNNLVGMLSELDCLRVILAGVYNDEEFGAAIVGDVMTTTVDVQDAHDDIVDVATSMLDHKHRRRPVVADGKLIGQVTCRQILRVMVETGLKDRKPPRK
jgi:CBS domain-containing protein